MPDLFGVIGLQLSQLHDHRSLLPVAVLRILLSPSCFLPLGAFFVRQKAVIWQV
ncbi:unnamed protein product [Ectocarpus sp. CCAP 1310/34]|nr:unnamed protein product [Ectocarpus sp. CCAP 1310/34]